VTKSPEDERKDKKQLFASLNEAPKPVGSDQLIAFVWKLVTAYKNRPWKGMKEYQLVKDEYRPISDPRVHVKARDLEPLGRQTDHLLLVGLEEVLTLNDEKELHHLLAHSLQDSEYSYARPDERDTKRWLDDVLTRAVGLGIVSLKKDWLDMQYVLQDIDNTAKLFYRKTVGDSRGRFGTSQKARQEAIVGYSNFVLPAVYLGRLDTTRGRLEPRPPHDSVEVDQSQMPNPPTLRQRTGRLLSGDKPREPPKTPIPGRHVPTNTIVARHSSPAYAELSTPDSVAELPTERPESRNSSDNEDSEKCVRPFHRLTID
jgi:hypothetical protein